MVIFDIRKAEIDALKRFQYLEGTQVIGKPNHFVIKYIDTGAFTVSDVEPNDFVIKYVDTVEYIDTGAFTVSDVELRSVPGRRWILRNICPY